MKCVLGRVILCLYAVLAVAACGGSLESSKSPEKASFLVPLQGEDPEGGYKLTKIDLLDLWNLQDLSGHYARFTVSPGVRNNRLYGSAPKARLMRNQEGTYIPRDILTQQLVAIYYHLQNLAAFDKEVGAENVNTWPRDVGIGVRVQGGMENNAQYSGELDAMYFVPYTQNHLPIAVNGGVLAHEYFHSLFYKLVKGDKSFKASLHDPIATSGSILENGLNQEVQMVYLRALNEGLADFWAWTYTADPDFLGRSLPSHKNIRSLKPQALLLTHENVVKSKLEFLRRQAGGTQESYHQVLGQLSYSIGTEVARVMKTVTEALQYSRGLQERQARILVASAVIRMLPQLDSSSLGPDQFLTLLAKETPELTEPECLVLAKIRQRSGIDGEPACELKNESWVFKKQP